MSFMRYNHAGINEGIQSMVNFVEHMDTKLEEIEEKCNTLVATWEGQAVEAYEAKKLSWNQSATTIRDTIISVTNRLDDGNQHMEQVDKMNAAKFDG